MAEFSVVDLTEASHAYLVRVGNVRGDTPQDIREYAIDLAVNDVPDVTAKYDIEPGYIVGLWDSGMSREYRGTGRLWGAEMMVRITVPAACASWLAPDAPGAAEARKAVRHG